jgi:copper chaperone CopZ
MLIGRVVRRGLVAAAIVAGAAASANAEHLRIEIKVFGMDCATCAHGLTVAMKKLQGVETVDISLNKSAAQLTLREGNQVTIEQLRTIIKRNGFTPKEAVVTTIGLPSRKSGGVTLEIRGQPSTLAIAPGSTPAAVKALTEAAARVAAPHVVSGTVSQKADGTEQIVVASAAPKP